MERTNRSGGLDVFKIAAALLVVAIHTSPLASFSGTADFLLTRVAARVAVPFFLMVTGYFLLPAYLFQKRADWGPLLRFFKKALVLYAAATLLYLPIGIYAGNYSPLRLSDLLRRVLFDGTFYHLWYLPAAMLGAALVCLPGRRLPLRAAAGIVGTLYCLGLLGDSYYGLAAGLPGLSGFYDAAFHIFSYSRNGFFFAPVFLFLGAWLGKPGPRISRVHSAVGLSLSLAAMALEALLLRHLGWQRHDSMYVALLPAMFFLYQLLLTWRREPSRALRTVSTWIYLIHPLMIVVVRGFAKVLGLTGPLVENSLCHFLAVCALSCVWSAAAVRLSPQRRKRGFPTGRAWVELDRSALLHNAELLGARLPAGRRLMAAVKADAYGHGAALMAKALNRIGVAAFCVASVPEGIALRKNGIRGKILILGYTHPAYFPALRRYRLAQTVLDENYAQVLNAYGKKIKAHIKIDTGMHRLGARCGQIESIRRICACGNLQIEGAFTHLCVADDASPEAGAFTLAQGQAFYRAAAQLRAGGLRCPRVHLLSSYGLLRYPELGGDYARVGIALYGVLSTAEDVGRWGAGLRPVLSLKARVALVRELEQGESAGYGLQFTADRRTKMAVLSIGYADGLPRRLSCGAGAVLIRGRRAPIIGRICMDQTLVDVTDLEAVQSGETAVIIGRDGDQEITACELAEQAGTISNEILSRLGPRLERIMI